MRNARLYIIPRTDMATMTPGRAIAQATHAATKFVFDIKHQFKFDKDSYNSELKEMLTDYLDEANGFGTTIVLKPKTEFDQEAEFNQLLDAVVNDESLDFVYPMIGNVVIDPEYAVKDGDHVHIVPDVVTCAYFFGDVDDMKQLLGTYELY